MTSILSRNPVARAVRVFLFHVAGVAAATLLSACGGAGQDTADALEGAAPSARSAQAAGAVPPDLWDASGQPLPTAPEDRPADPAAAWSGQRYATRAQLAHEELIASTQTVVIEVPNANAVDRALQAAEQLRTYHSGSTKRLGVFVRAMSAADADELDQRLRGDVVWIAVDCCGDEAIGLALGVTYGVQAAKSLPASAPVLVTAVDQRLAAKVVNQLADAGMSQVFLVTP
ncbi:MAG: hypothetical protein IPI03_03745 [Rubrivivax sp.]|jgi:hypothetical protein|nr:hypothetical protein [Rubrivivax sp.]MBK7261042.1 hypothetical protein [Rubrivivax sp.]MBK8525978.1 hypothetical protein [Rubrivivax sp.]